MQPPEQVIRRSAQEVQTATPTDLGSTYGTGDLLSEVSMFTIAEFADEIVPWGVWTKLRDVQLREFLPTETHLASAFATVAARNAAFSWKIDGGPRLVQRAQDILQYANFGAGWRNFVTRLSLDMAGQDNGAFIEVIRSAERATAEVIGIANLDAGRCWRTGDPRNPVLYTDLKGGRHLLPYYRVIVMAEMPSNIERLRGIQYSAMSRILGAARLFRDIHQFHREKMGGRNPGAIHLVGGVSAQALKDVLLKAKAQADNLNLYRYMDPLVVESLKPGEPVTAVTIELRSLPDNFDADMFWKQYITGLAMALLMDVQDLAPLPGGGLGSGMQSEVLAQKTRGKGPALFMKLVEDAFNFYGVLGQGVTFSFDEQDLVQDQEVATVRKTQAEADAVLVNAGILTTQIVRQRMVDRGELDEEYLKLMAEQDVTDESTGTDMAPVESQAEVDAEIAAIPAPAQTTPAAPTAPVAPQNNRLTQIGAPKAIKDPQHTAMDDTEAAAKERFTDALASARGAFTRAVRNQVPAEAKVVAEVKAVAAEAQQALAAQSRGVEAALRATVEDLQDTVSVAIAEAADTNLTAIKASARENAEATRVLAEAVRLQARPKRRVVEKRDQLGLVQSTREEYVE